MRRPSLLVIVYLVIGVIVALVKDYFDNVEGLKAIGSAALAIVLWPLVLFGVDLHLGKGGGGGNRGLLLVGATWSWLKERLSPLQRTARTRAAISPRPVDRRKSSLRVG